MTSNFLALATPKDDDEDEEEDREELETDGDPALAKKDTRTEAEIDRDTELMNFTAFILNHFPSVEAAFKGFDLNGNGLLSAIEFTDGARVSSVARGLFTDGGGVVQARWLPRVIRKVIKILDFYVY